MDKKKIDITIVGFTGFARSGKDTAGEYLCKHYGFTRVAFADALKEACRIIFGFSHDQLYGNLKEVVDKFWGHTPREILQKVGTELFREKLPEVCENINNNIWVNSVLRKIINYHEKDPAKTKFVITDVRFPNESKFIMDNGGYVFRVNRFDLPTKGLHASESAIPKLSVTADIANRRKVSDFYKNIDDYMETIKMDKLDSSNSKGSD